ncbi:MAG: hypothetical protein JO043_05685, partial [Candidatus Eremiobacteraeota bacterium]|nr:hypothetical protein [Candidatus Eremiobacteraeota bacterium]
MGRPLRVCVSLLFVCAVGASPPAIAAGGIHLAPKQGQLWLQRQTIHRHQKIQHIVVLVQENRTIDNLFNGFCVAQFVCADTVSVDPYRGVPLQPQSLAGPVEPVHNHKSFVREYDGGTMTGFAKDYYAFVPATENAAYRALVTLDGVLGDEVFQPNMGASFPAHQYEIAGQSGGYDPEHEAIVGNPKKHNGSTCIARPNSRVQTIDMTSKYPGHFSSDYPCENYQTIFDLLANRGISWRYYTRSEQGIWVPTQTIRHLYGSPNHITPETRFFKDLARGDLASVTYITPDARNSDHAGFVKDPLAGPRWVSRVANAI